MYLGMKSKFLNSVAMAGLWYRLKSLLQFERRTSLGILQFARILTLKFHFSRPATERNTILLLNFKRLTYGPYKVGRYFRRGKHIANAMNLANFFSVTKYAS